MSNPSRLRGRYCSHDIVTNGQCWRPDQDRRATLEFIESLAVSITCHRGQQIFGPHDPAEHWYRLVSGAASKCALTAEGRRQILEFLLPGDFFGFTAHDKHVFAVEAVVEGTIVARYLRRRLQPLADSEPRLAQLVRDVAFEEISRLQDRMLILGQMTALEKVGAFLAEMGTRLTSAESEAFMLVMSRYDIADYLALSSETVSRTITDLRRRGAIRLTGSRRVKIVDRRAMEANSNDDSTGRGADFPVKSRIHVERKQDQNVAASRVGRTDVNQC